MTTPLFVPSRVYENFTLWSERKFRASEILSGGGGGFMKSHSSQFLSQHPQLKTIPVPDVSRLVTKSVGVN